MGMVMSFIAVAAARLATLDEAEDAWNGEAEGDLDRLDRLVDELLAEVDGAGYDNGELPSCYLDKAWDGLTFLLGQARAPVDLEICVRGWIATDGTGSVWSADEVRAAADYLRSTPFERLARHYDPSEMTLRDVYPSIIWERDGDEALDYLRAHYRDLMRFFDVAARAGAGAVQTLG